MSEITWEELQELIREVEQKQAERKRLREHPYTLDLIRAGRTANVGTGELMSSIRFGDYVTMRALPDRRALRTQCRLPSTKPLITG